MAEVTMPRLSDTMEEGTISSWLKKPGDQVSKGEVIAQIETDKATMDLTAFEAGTLQEILAAEGSTVQIGAPVARIGSGDGSAAKAPESRPPAGKAPESRPPEAAPEASSPAAAEATVAEKPETAEARANASEAPEASSEPAAEPGGDESVVLPAAPAREGAPAEPATNGKVRASPVARHLAAEHGLDLSQIHGTGPQGRVIRSDVEAALASGTTTAVQEQATAEQPAAPSAAPVQGDERVQLSQMRRTIARRMAESTRTIPHFFLTVAVDATELVKLRKQIVDQGVKVSFNDLVVKGAALALRKVPEVNVSFAEDSLIKRQQVNIGIAVATERGLIVPVVRDVDRKSLSAIAQESRDLAERAQAGKLQPNDYSGGTFTVSNLGMFGVEQFNAVINPPEAAILAVGAIVKEPAEHEGEVALRDRMHLTLSVDHRALDGATGARYLQALKELLEKQLLLLV
ncbi:MAG TPA: dihydrolipoamide acetyltransferase family protein [Chloroflexota bacterium]|nr:dihydrolipoamide acetyltransferase family protein [Chloroflexota bacterium]